MGATNPPASRTRSPSPTTRDVSPRKRLRGWSTTPRSSRTRTISRRTEFLQRTVLKATIEDEKVADKISEDHKKKITEKCDEAIKWLDANQLAEVEEFQDKQKEVEGVCNPIITKLYQSAGGAGGMPDMGGMPGGMPGAGGAPPSGGSGSGPTIEEV